MIDFSKSDDVMRWLNAITPEGRRREVAVAIAARAALRVLPLLVRGLPKRRRDYSTMISDLYARHFRAAEVSWVIGKYPHIGNSLRTAAAAAREAVVSAKGDPVGSGAAIYAANAASADMTATAVASAATATNDAANAIAGYFERSRVETEYSEPGYVEAGYVKAGYVESGDEYSTANTSDVMWIDEGHAASGLAGRPLWPDGSPSRHREAWRQLKALLLARDEDWDVWTDWYDARLRGDAGHPPNEALEIARATIADEIWKQGPKVVNAEIKRLIAENVRAPAAEPGDSATWNYFVSYASEDEADAREIVNVLERDGSSTIAQFKDFAVGANFVNEMNRGLAGAARVIAIYSPAYQASAHCQAEWAAAYNADPSGAKRKLVPFLIKPTSLTPLARQVVLKSLVGLNKAQREKAIIAAIAAQPHSKGAFKERLAEVASPQASLNLKGQLDAEPNVLYDRPFVDADLPELPSVQRTLAATLRGSLPPNTPPIVRNCLEAYADHLLERGAQPIVRLLDDLSAALRDEFNAPDRIVWGAGLETLFERFFRNDSLLRTHFPLAGEEVYSEIPINESGAVGDALTDPIRKVDSALDKVVDANKATPEISKVVRSSANFARDLASLPLSGKPSDPNSKRVTVKRRYVLGTIGFLLTVYNLIGTTASIYGLPEGAALLKAVGEAIERYMSFIL